MKKTYISSAFRLLVLTIIFISPLKSMEYDDCEACCEYNQALQSVDTLYKKLRTAMFAQVPFKKHALEDIDDENISSFKKKGVKEKGLLSFFQDDHETTKLFLAHVFYSSFKPKLSKKIVPIYHRYPDITLDVREIQETIKDYCVELLFQNLHQPVKSRQLKTCTCPKATLYDKIGCTLKVVSTLPTLFPPDHCNADQPLSCEYFGSGLLLSEYLLSYILGKRGYHHQSLYCIDKAYSENHKCCSLFNEFQNHLHNNGIKTTIKVSPTPTGFLEFKQMNPLKNHVLIAIDPGDPKQITEPNLLHNATGTYIIFSSESLNQQHGIEVDFSTVHDINIKHRDRKIYDNIPATQKTQKMDKQIYKFDRQLRSIKPQPDNVAFIHELLGMIHGEEQKFKEHKDPAGYTAIKIAWQTNPLREFENIAHNTPSALTLMVHSGVQEFDGKKFKSLI